MGGTSSDIAYSIALDALGNVYTTGIFNGIADFDPGVGTYTLNSSTGSFFVSKFSPLLHLTTYIPAENLLTSI